MVRLYCDFDDTRDVACGLAEPLHFEDGYADVDDEEEAARIVGRHQHIHYASAQSDATVRDADEELPVDPSELSVAELHDWAADTDDLAALDAVIAAEYSGGNRSSAIERLEQRQSALEESDE